MAASNLWSKQNSLRRNWMPEQPLLLTYWLLRHPVFFDSPHFPTQSVRPPLVTYPSLCSTCVTYRTLFHAIGHQVLPTQPLPREVEDFSRGDKHFKHVPPPTYLIYFSPKGVYVVGSIYVLRPLHGTLINPSLVLNQHFKSPVY